MSNEMELGIVEGKATRWSRLALAVGTALVLGFWTRMAAAFALAMVLFAVPRSPLISTPPDVVAAMRRVSRPPVSSRTQIRPMV